MNTLKAINTEIESSDFIVLNNKICIHVNCYSVKDRVACR